MRDKTLRWFGTTLCIAGIALTSFNFYPLNLWLGFSGSYLWAVAGYRDGDFALFSVEAVAVLFYFAGLINWWIA